MCVCVCVCDSPFTCQGAAGLDVPWVSFDGVERQALGDLGRRHRTFHVLFVGEDEDGGALQILHVTTATTTDYQIKRILSLEKKTLRHIRQNKEQLPQQENTTACRHAESHGRLPHHDASWVCRILRNGPV